MFGIIARYNSTHGTYGRSNLELFAVKIARVMSRVNQTTRKGTTCSSPAETAAKGYLELRIVLFPFNAGRVV